MARFPKARWAGLLALVCLLLASVPVLADNNMQGTIVSVHPDANVVDLRPQQGGLMNFRVDAATQILINNRAGTIRDLAPGDQATVTYEVGKDEMVAMVIRCTRNEGR